MTAAILAWLNRYAPEPAPRTCEHGHKLSDQPGYDPERDGCEECARVEAEDNRWEAAHGR